MKKKVTVTKKWSCPNFSVDLVLPSLLLSLILLKKCIDNKERKVESRCIGKSSKPILMLLYSLIIRLNSVLDPSLIPNTYNPLGCEERSTKTMFS